MRIKSDKESIGSDGTLGWIHETNGKPIDYKRVPKPPARSPKEWKTEAVKYYHAPRAEAFRSELAHRLGVSVESLEELRVGVWGEGEREFATFPIWDWDRNIIGIITRMSSGKKLCIKGSKNSGLFYALSWDKTNDCIFIPEGPSDVAAFLSAGLTAIGRPNNTGGVEQLKRILKPVMGKRRIVVVGENDAKPEKRGTLDGCPEDCEGCGYCSPGLFGAKWVAGKLGVSYIMPPKGYKDFRAYWKSGSVWTDSLEML